MKAINAREECISKIRTLDAEENKKQQESKQDDGGKT